MTYHNGRSWDFYSSTKNAVIYLCVIFLLGNSVMAGSPTGSSGQKVLPERVVNHQYLPVVGNQGRNPVCILFHMTYYCLTWIKAKEHGWIHPDPAVNPERVMSWEFGDFLPSSQGYMRHGCATYGDIASGWNEMGWPTRDQWEAALRNRIWGYEQITVSGPDKLTELKTKLSEGNIGMTSLMSTDSFEQYGRVSPLVGIDGEVMYGYAGQDGGGHAVTFIGFDDTIVWEDELGQQHQGAFLGVNSWGTTWGVSVPEIGTLGFIWLAYDFVEALSMTVDFPINRPEEIPQALAVIEWEHPIAHQISQSLLAGRPQDPDWELDYSLLKFGVPVKTRMVLDITEPWQQGRRDFWCRSYTADFINHQNPLQGSVNYFAIEVLGIEEPWICPNTPARTVSIGDLSYPSYLWLSVGLMEDEGPLDEEIALGSTRQIWGDFDGDGDPEGLLYGNYKRDSQFVYPSYMMFPSADGQVLFQPSGLPEDFVRLVSGDLNGDGALDLLTAPIESGSLRAWTFAPFSQRFVELPLSLPQLSIGYYGDFSLVDFNNDGRLDISTLEHEFEGDDPIAFRLWLAQEDGSFVDSAIRLDYRQYTRMNALDWCDVDGDGWIDLAVTANVKFHIDDFDEDYYGSRIVVLHNNNGGGLSEISCLGPYGLPGGNITFGDANNDGLPDLAIAGINYVYLNRGGGNFEEKDPSLFFFDKTRIDWCDINNDGFSDLLTTGDRGTIRDYYTTLWLNRGDESFVFGGGGALPGLWGGSLGQVDLDKDGDIDLVGAGWIEDAACWEQLEKTVRIFRNRIAEQSGFNRKNNPPSIPKDLNATWDSEGNLTVTWSPSQDDITPSASLQYHLRVGSFPGWNDIVSGAYGSDGLANQGYRTFAMVKGVTNPTVYYSVQAVDGAGFRSVWSAPLLVQSGPGQDSFDITREGILDAVDLISCLRIINGQESSQDNRGDINLDGSVSLLDQQFVLNRLLATGMPNSDVVAVENVGPGGGVISLDGFELSIPSGQFQESTKLTVYRDSSERPDGDNSVSPLYRIEGLPAEGLTAFHLRIQADRSFVEDPLLAYGMEGWRTSGGTPGRGRIFFPAVSAQDSWFEYTVSPSGSKQTTKSNYQWESLDGWFGLASGKGRVTSDHFQMVFPINHDYVAISQLLDALEQAYTIMKDTAGFSYANMPTNKIQSEVLDRGVNEYGSFVNFPGTKFDKLEFNTKDIRRDQNVVRQTAFHEFAHCVHAQFFNSVFNDFYWVDEASAVWAETLAVPSSIPDPFITNAAAPMRGMMAGISPSEEKHGYGMSVLFRYMEEVYVFPTRASSVVWGYLNMGWSVPKAFRDALNAEDFKWYTDFLQQHVEGNLYGYDWSDIDRDAPNEQTFDLSASDLDYAARFDGTIPDLSGMLFQTPYNKSGIPDDAVLSQRLVAPEYVDLTAYKYISPNTTTRGGMGKQQNGVIKFDLPLAGWSNDNRHRALTLLSNRQGNMFEGYTGRADFELMTAVTWNRQYPMPSGRAVYPNIYQGIPAFNVTGVFEGPGLTDVMMRTLENIGGQGDCVGVFTSAILMGETPTNLILDFDVIITDTHAVEVLSSTIKKEYSVSAIKQYKLEYYKDSEFAHQMTMYSPDGRFSLNIEESTEFFSGTAAAIYDVSISTVEDGIVTASRVESDEQTNIGAFYLVF